MKNTILLISLLFSSLVVISQTTVSWNFGTAAANPAPSGGAPVSNLIISDISQGNNNGTTTLLTTTSVSSGYTGVSGQYNAGAAARIGSLNTAAAGSAYFEFTLTPSAGYTVSLTAVDFGSRSTATGPQAYSIRSSLTSYSTDVATGILPNNSAWALYSSPTSVISGAGSPVTIRIYGYNGTGSPSANTANWRIDDLAITVTVSSGAPDTDPPLVSILTPADNATDVSASTSLSITFNENILKGATGNIVLKKTSDNTIVETIPVNSAAVSLPTGNSAMITITPLALSTSYYVEIDAGSFTDLSLNSFGGISGNTTWNFTTGAAIYRYNFNTCTSSLSDGFTAYSAVGAQIWACTTFGRDANNLPTGSAPSGVQINGFNVTNIANEDWLISPAFNLTSTNYPLLSFWSRTKFNGLPLKLKISTDYPGTGDPRLSTWTDLNGGFPGQTSDVWTLSQNIDLSGFKSANTFIAFVYISSADDGARWTLDDIRIDNSATAPPPNISTSTNDILFGFVPVTTASVETFNFTGTNLSGDITITAGSNFLVSKTNGSFTSSITYSQVEANNITQTVYVQFIPPMNSMNYPGSITLVTSGVSPVIVNTSGNSIDAAITLEVVNWNIEWFGSTANGPTNDAQQEQNVKTILQDVGADVYALSEVVDEARLANIVSQMPGYAYVISNYGSHTNTSVNPVSNLAEAQKLAFIYKTSVVNPIGAPVPLLSQGINSAADISNPAYNYFASGRFPYMLTAEVTLGSITKTVRFILIHGKANTSPTATSYARRKSGSDTLNYTLNTLYPADNIILLGDFNDDLDSTITDGINPKITSYVAFTTDNTHFTSPTLSLSLAGKKSTVSYNDMIDHVELSNEMLPYYMSNTVSVLTDVTSLVTGYSSTTTDHYPVFSRYAFDPLIVPVKLVSFTAIKQNETVQLRWTTSQEINSKSFIVERSVDGTSWSSVATIAAAGTSNTTIHYSAIDFNPASGINYYRLKQIDQDDRYEYSATRTVTFNGGSVITISPNPASTYLIIQVDNITQKKIIIQLWDANGKLVRTAYSSDVTTNLDIAGLGKGLYFVKVIKDDEVIVRKVLVN